MSFEYNRDKLVKKTILFSRKKAKELKKKLSRNKHTLAKWLYKNENFNYGFDEAVETGNYGQFPHELKDYVECMTYAIYQYVIADALDLKPKIYFVYSLKDHPDNIRNKFGSYDHAFIDVDIGRKKRLMIDTQLNMFGFVNYDNFEKTITVRDNHYTKNRKKSFDRMEELSFDDLVDKLMYYRSPEGAIKLLEEGQQTRKRLPITYYFDKETDTLEVRINANNGLSSNNAQIHKHHYNDKGEIDASSLLFGLYSDTSWIEYKNWVRLGEFDTKVLVPFLEVLDNYVSLTYNNSTWKGRKPAKEIIDLISEYNLSDFNIETVKIPDKIKNREKVILSLKKISELVKKEYENLKEQENFQLIEKSLAVKELYSIEIKKRILGKKDNQGFIFKQEERDSELVKTLEKYYNGYTKVVQKERAYVLESIKNKKRYHGSLASTFHSFDRVRDISRETCLIEWERSHNRKRYDEITDTLCYQRQMLKKLSLDELKEKVEKEGGNLYNAYKTLIFSHFMTATKSRPTTIRLSNLDKVSEKIEKYKMFTFIKNRIEDMKESNPKLYQKMSDELYTEKTYRNLKRIYNKMSSNEV